MITLILVHTRQIHQRFRTCFYALLAMMVLFFGPFKAVASEGNCPEPDDLTSVTVPIDSSQEMAALRKQMAHRQRRIIYNNDGDDITGLTLGLKNLSCSKENFLRLRCRDLEGSQVDTISYCWRPAGGALLDYGNFTRDDLREQIAKRHDGQVNIDVDAAWELRCESMAIMIDFAHQNGMEIFWSARMNDTHDSANPFLLSEWKKNNPQCLMGQKGDKFPYGGGRWSALNYARGEVRDRIFAITKDICCQYDIDGVELDFFRHPVFFQPQMVGEPVTQDHCELMTELLRRIRRMTDETGGRRGRPMLIAVRVPDSVGYSKAIGLDLRQWLKDDLVDLVIGGGYFHLQPWEDLVALGREYEAPVYACISSSRVHKCPDVRNEVLNARRAGVDGIGVFNYFNPKATLWRQWGSLETLGEFEPDRSYQPITIGQHYLGYWLKDGQRHLYEVTINSTSGKFFSESTTIDMAFPSEDYQIRYTLDGTPPTANSALYQGPFALDQSAEICARGFTADGVLSGVSYEKIVRYRHEFICESNGVPFRIYGQPVGTSKAVTFSLTPAFSDYSVVLYLSMGDVDEQKEVEIYINDQGPLNPPKSIVHDVAVVSSVMNVPVSFFKTGENRIKFVFADNLRGQTSGFSVEDVRLLLEH